MKNFLKSVSLIGLLFSGLTSNAQNDNSLLWKISGNGLEKPSYVFGTIHMICEDDYIMTPVIEKTIQSVDAYYAELDFSNMVEMTRLQKEMVAEKPLSQRIDADTYKHLQELLKEVVNLDITHFENLSDAAITSVVTMKSYPCETQKSYEVELLQKALKENKKMGGLESVEFQINVMKKTMDVKTLITMLEELKDKGFETTQKMVSLYTNQQIDDLIRFMNETSYMNEDVYEIMLVERNKNWSKIIPELMKEESAFFAVGAGHLGGEIGILQLLRDQGYEVSPISIN